MDFSDLKNKFFVVLCIFIVFLPFIIMTNIYAAENEIVEVSTVNGLTINSNSNVFTETSNTRAVGYVLCDPNYIYYIYCPSDFTSSRRIATSSDIPALNGIYNYLGEIQPGETFTFRPVNNEYIYLDWAFHNGAMVVTRSKIESMDGAVDDLVNYVGINSVWNVFDSGINYIYVVVLVAFGIFIISLIIRRLTKGKEGF